MIVFASSAALWLVLPVAILLWERFRRRDRRRLVVGTISLWRRLAERVVVPTQRPRPPLELVLEALLALLLVVLAAGPLRRDEGATEVLVLVDDGPAMQVPARRHELERALAEIEHRAGRPAIVRQAPAGGDLGAALAALARDDRELWLVADDLAGIETLPEGAGLVVCAAPFANLGLAAAGLEPVADGRELFALVARSPSGPDRGARLVVTDASGRELAARELAFAAAEDRLACRLHLAAEPAGDVLLQLEGPTGPDFDDRLGIEHLAGGGRPLVLPFAGDEAWWAALAAAGLEPLRALTTGPEGAAAVMVTAGAAPEGPALVAAAAGIPGRLELRHDPALVGRRLEAGTELLADLPALAELAAARGAFFELLDPTLKVLARRGDRAVIVQDPARRQLFLAEPESANGWRESAAFPLLVTRLHRLLTEAEGRWRPEPAPAMAEIQGRAADPARARPAAPARPRVTESDLVPVVALLALLVLGALAFLRRRPSPRRESAGGH
ncbi:MAG: BatA domain-containing protein [Planctomycetes bacterium]|nr:BatA domain-containing protein [Planctomycetota bacterium]